MSGFIIAEVQQVIKEGPYSGWVKWRGGEGAKEPRDPGARWRWKSRQLLAGLGAERERLASVVTTWGGSTEAGH